MFISDFRCIIVVAVMMPVYKSYFIEVDTSTIKCLPGRPGRSRVRSRGGERNMANFRLFPLVFTTTPNFFLSLLLLGRPRSEAASRVPRCTEAEVRTARGWQEDGKRLGGLASGANAIRQPRRAAARGNWPHSTRAMGEGQEELCKGLQTESALFWKQGWADPEGGGGRRRGWVGDRSCSFPCLLYEVLGWVGWLVGVGTYPVAAWVAELVLLYRRWVSCEGGVFWGRPSWASCRRGSHVNVAVDASVCLSGLLFVLLFVSFPDGLFVLFLHHCSCVCWNYLFSGSDGRGILFTHEFNLVPT